MDHSRDKIKKLPDVDLKKIYKKLDDITDMLREEMDKIDSNVDMQIVHDRVYQYKEAIIKELGERSLNNIVK